MLNITCWKFAYADILLRTAQNMSFPYPMHGGGGSGGGGGVSVVAMHDDIDDPVLEDLDEVEIDQP